jgi:hypothetical protein
MMALDRQVRALLPGLAASLDNRRAALATARADHDDLVARRVTEARDRGEHTRAHDYLVCLIAHATEAIADHTGMIAELEAAVSVLAPQAASRHEDCIAEAV